MGGRTVHLHTLFWVSWNGVAVVTRQVGTAEACLDNLLFLDSKIVLAWSLVQLGKSFQTGPESLPSSHCS